MLVLSRKSGQKLIIGGNIEIVIIESSNYNVKIGIKAPKEISVHREEIWREIKESNKTAEKTSFDALDELTSMITFKDQAKDEKLKTIVTKVNKPNKPNKQA